MQVRLTLLVCIWLIGTSFLVAVGADKVVVLDGATLPVRSVYTHYGPRAISTNFNAGYCPNLPTEFDVVKTVSSESEFIDAYASLNPGHAIIVEDGTYDWDLVKYLSRSGVTDKPLFILAESYLGVKFNASSGTFQLGGEYNVLAGFRWQAQNAQAVKVSGDNNTIACNHFSSANAGSYISIDSAGAGDYTEIRDNVFNGHNVSCSSSGGWAVVVNGSKGLEETKFVRIHHNKWTNEPACKTNGHEALIVGGGLEKPPEYNPFPPNYDSPNDMRATIESNLFDGWNGEDELISIKSDRNIIRNNCIINTPGAGISIRQGSGNLIYGNWMIGMGRGIRDGGWRNYIVFNFFHGRGRNAFIRVHQDVATYLDPDSSLYRYNIVSNTGFWMQQFVNGKPDSAPERMTVVDNVMYSDQYISEWMPISHTWDQWLKFSGNTFHNNSVIPFDLTPNETVAGCGDSALFDGPGKIIRLDPVHSDQKNVNAPVWW